MRVRAVDTSTRRASYPSITVPYVFVVMEIASRRIVHTNVTTNPTLPWGQQQFREATAWDANPRFLVHDNDGIYGQLRSRTPPAASDRPRRSRCHLDRWLQEVLGITGIPIPYGAPNASPHVERFNRTLRAEALTHFLFWSVAHLRRVVTTYVRYDNRARPSQAMHRTPAPYPALRTPPPVRVRAVDASARRASYPSITCAETDPDRDSQRT